MKAITVHEPYATLLALSLKEYETRGWGAPANAIGSLVVIHAGKNDETLIDLFETASYAKANNCSLDADSFEWHVIDALRTKRKNQTYGDFKLGYGIAVGTLKACIPMTYAFIDSLSDRERAFGFYAVGRFAWQFADMRLLDEPVAARGQLGVWEWTHDIAVKAEAL